MLRWLKRLVDRTPQLSTEDLDEPESRQGSARRSRRGSDRPIRPPPAPPPEVTEDYVVEAISPSADAVPRLAEAPPELDALCTKVFEHFRSNPDELPTFPALAIQIFQLLERPKEDIDVNQLVQVVSREPATAALMLRVANSSRYGGQQHIASVRDAVVRLGIGEVSNLAVAAASRTLFDSGERIRLAHFEQLWSHRWRHALTTAFTASWLSMETRIGQPQEAFVAGLLHDLGKSLALRVLGQLVIDGHWTEELTSPTIETVLDSTHVDIGSEASVRWGLPVFVVDVCQEHHSADASGLPLVVQLASNVYELRHNPLYRTSLPSSIARAAANLNVDQRQFALMNTQLTAFAAAADDISSSARREPKLKTG